MTWRDLSRPVQSWLIAGVALELWDTAATLRHAGIEVNPIVRALLVYPPAFVGVKVTICAALVALTWWGYARWPRVVSGVLIAHGVTTGAVVAHSVLAELR